MVRLVPIDACHILLGQPWQLDRYAIQDGFKNTYIVNYKGKGSTYVYKRTTKKSLWI